MTDIIFFVHIIQMYRKEAPIIYIILERTM